MALLDVPLDRIDESHLQRLISTKAAELLYIEYKSTTYGGNDQQRREFLADISSFANTVGGDLVIGMTEIGGVPTGFNPFPVYPDGELLRLDDMARSGLQPLISDLKTSVVPISAGGYVIVVRIPRSFNAPHRVIFTKSNRFYVRSSVSPRKIEAGVDELRRLFTEAPQLAERIRNFRVDRVAKIAVGETPVPLAAGRHFVMHVVPYSAFDFHRSLSLAEVERQWTHFPPPARRQPTHWYINFDGFLGLSNAEEAATRQHSYVQVFRSGIIEAVTTVSEGRNGVISTTHLDAITVRYARLYAASLHGCGVNPPMAILVSLLLGLEQASFITQIGQGLFPDTPVPADRQQLHFVEGILEAIPANDQNCARVLRPTLDHIANAAGRSRAPTFDDAGNYTLHIPG